MLSGYALLVFPTVSFLISGSLAIWLYYKTRLFWRNFLDVSRGARFIYATLAVVVLPLILGAWSDIVDLSKILQGDIQGEQAVTLSALTAILALYLYIHGCWFDRDEVNLAARKIEEGKISELNCQKNYLVRLLENFRACIGRYAERLQASLDSPDQSTPVSDRLPVDLARDNIRMIIEAVRQTYRSVETVPNDYTIKANLLHLQDGYLVHFESYDGTNWDCYKAECDSHREYFNTSNPNCSVAVAATVSKTIHIIEDCCDCHSDDSHPFWFFQDCMAIQKEELGSMIVIPFEPQIGNKFVLCLSCSQPRAFLRKHKWKAKAIQENLEARLSLLFCQTSVFDAIRAEVTNLRTQIEDLACTSEGERLELREANNRIQSLERSAAEARDKEQELTSQLEQKNDEILRLDGELTAKLRQLEELQSTPTTRRIRRNDKDGNQ